MQAFGFDADIDANSRRKQVSRPKGVATVAQVRRRAAQYGDIVDIATKKRVNMQHAVPKRACPEVQAVDIDSHARRGRGLASPRVAAASSAVPAGQSYDTQTRRRFFDGQAWADRYAHLLGRPGDWTRADAELPRFEDGGVVPPAHESLLTDFQDAPLPPQLRRVLESLLPGKSDRAMRGMPPHVFDRVRAQVEAMVIERLTVDVNHSVDEDYMQNPEDASYPEHYIPPAKMYNSKGRCSDESLSTAPELDRGMVEMREDEISTAHMSEDSRGEFDRHSTEFNSPELGFRGTLSARGMASIKSNQSNAPVLSGSSSNGGLPTLLFRMPAQEQKAQQQSSSEPELQAQ